MAKFSSLAVFVGLNLFGISWSNLVSAAVCNGTSFVPGSFITGSCFSGHCNGQSFSQQLMVNGSCNDGSQFEASAYLPGVFIQGECMGGSFNANLLSQTLFWNGQCGNGGNFFSPATFLPGGFAYGSCQENGTFTVSVPASQIFVDAQCGN